MFTTLLLAVLPGQFVDSPDFPRQRQQAALEATVGVFQPATREEGSGVIVGQRDGLIFVLTAAHVVPDVPKGNEVRLELYSLKSFPKVHVEVNGLVTQRMPEIDVAVVVGPCKDPPAVLPIQPVSKRPKIERFPMPALTVGCDGAYSVPKIQVDQVLGKRSIPLPDRAGALFWECQTPQAVGRSGGPLVNVDGYVIGVCSGKVPKRGYYSYIREIHHALKQHNLEWLYKE